MPVRNDTKTPTTTKTLTPKTPTPAETKAAEAAAKAKAEEGAEDLGAAPTSTEKHLTQNELNAARGDIRRAFITGESGVVMDKLAKLPAADARAVLDEIAADPDKLATMMKGDNKTAFLQLMTSKGYVGVEPATTPPTPRSPRAPQPPAAQSMYRDDAKLPAPLREALLKENIASAKQYNEDFAAYRADYQAAIKETKSVGELRALGPLAEPQTPEHLPGAKLSDPNNLKYEKARGANVPDTETGALLGDQLRRLTGRPIPGDISFSVEGKALLKLGPHDAHWMAGGEGKVKVVDGHAHGHAEGITGTEIHGAFVESDVHGDNVTVGYEDHHAHVGGSLKVGEEGVEAKGKAGGVYVKGGVSSENEMSIGAGLAGDVPLGEFGALEVEVGASVGFQGVTSEDAEQFASSSQVGFFDTPPELGRKSWSSLPEETRTDYEHQGWSEKEWSTRSDLEKAKRR